ncbi:putative mitochondrial protein, partial [Mucuna pruriens]
MEESKSISTPMNQKELSKEDVVDKIDEGYYRSLIGCLMYITTTKSDILFAINLYSQLMHCASEMLLRAVKRILRYGKGTVDYGVKFKKCQEFKFYGFFDSDWARSIDNMKSTLRYCFSLGSRVSLGAQRIQSTIEAEFIAATTIINQALWLKKILWIYICNRKIEKQN